MNRIYKINPRTERITHHAPGLCLFKGRKRREVIMSKWVVKIQSGEND
jgi:hypothetical protein